MVQALPTWARRPEGSPVLLNPSPEGRAGEEVGGQKQETTVKARSIWAVGWGAPLHPAGNICPEGTLGISARFPLRSQGNGPRKGKGLEVRS